jgi:hypothetical protein
MSRRKETMLSDRASARARTLASAARVSAIGPPGGCHPVDLAGRKTLVARTWSTRASVRSTSHVRALPSASLSDRATSKRDIEIHPPRTAEVSAGADRLQDHLAPRRGARARRSLPGRGAARDIPSPCARIVAERLQRAREEPRLRPGRARRPRGRTRRSCRSRCSGPRRTRAGGAPRSARRPRAADHEGPLGPERAGSPPAPPSAAPRTRTARRSGRPPRTCRTLRQSNVASV